MKLKSKSMRVLSLLLIILSISSCSVNYSMTGADVPAEAKTVSVTYFRVAPKATLAAPNAGDLFTNELIATMLTQTNLDLVENDGDLQYSGEIIGYNPNIIVGVQSGTEASDRNRLKMTVKVSYVSKIDPDKNFTKEFSHFADYDSGQNLGDVEEDLLSIINETIAQDIFNASLGSW